MHLFAHGSERRDGLVPLVRQTTDFFAHLHKLACLLVRVNFEIFELFAQVCFLRLLLAYVAKKSIELAGQVVEQARHVDRFIASSAAGILLLAIVRNRVLQLLNCVNVVSFHNFSIEEGLGLGLLSCRRTSSGLVLFATRLDR